MRSQIDFHHLAHGNMGGIVSVWYGCICFQRTFPVLHTSHTYIRTSGLWTSHSFVCVSRSIALICSLRNEIDYLLGSRICAEVKKYIGLHISFVIGGLGSPPSCRWGPIITRRWITVKKADKPDVVIISGNHNKVSFGGKPSFLPLAIVALAIAMVVLAISLCCPDSLADFVRWMISIAINS